MMLVPLKRKDRGELAKLHDEMDGLLGRFFGDWGWPDTTHTHWPALDVAENENSYVVKAEIPGCQPGDVDISVNGNVLTISGEKKQLHRIDLAACIKCGICREVCSFDAVDVE